MKMSVEEIGLLGFLLPYFHYLSPLHCTKITQARCSFEILLLACHVYFEVYIQCPRNS